MRKSAPLFCALLLSLSARRAWIEIASDRRVSGRAFVALRKESVDRNTNPGSTTLTFPGSLSARRAWIEISQRRDFRALGLLSLSARRAWIEILLALLTLKSTTVALRKESVDRNV